MTVFFNVNHHSGFGGFIVQALPITAGYEWRGPSLALGEAGVSW